MFTDRSLVSFLLITSSKSFCIVNLDMVATKRATITVSLPQTPVLFHDLMFLKYLRCNFSVINFNEQN